MSQSLREIVAVAERILIEVCRTRRSMVFWIVFPTLMLLLFGLIYGSNDQLVRSFDATAPGILIGAALFFSCLGGPVAILVGERERRTLRRALLSSAAPSSYFLGIVLAHAVIAAGQAVIVYGVAAAFGARFRGSWPLGLFILGLAVASYVGMWFLFGARFSKRTEDVNGPVSAFGVPLLVLGGTFFPPDLLPPFLLRLAYLNPIYHMNEALKPVSALGASLTDVRVLLGVGQRLVIETNRHSRMSTHAYLTCLCQFLPRTGDNAAGCRSSPTSRAPSSTAANAARQADRRSRDSSTTATRAAAPPDPLPPDSCECNASPEAGACRRPGAVAVRPRCLPPIRIRAAQRLATVPLPDRGPGGGSGFPWRSRRGSPRQIDGPLRRGSPRARPWLATSEKARRARRRGSPRGTNRRHARPGAFVSW